ncbi:S-adenosyl-L-methionine-dependent methyltransferase [Ophiobolus disseminans]|uniref:S-adenosyl-L-methionine-dependent methyltransferase n=1 Tax=Ophiobolus disseminans TaxID=1469910 RepID=A0A6A7A5Z0_9PLEO|nr:S-adenosyl-L-methionine-dependent methyltransferase [Ophiobolus disseminans]
MASTSLTTSIIRDLEAWETSPGEAQRHRLISSATKLIENLENPAEKLARIGWGEPSRTAALTAAFELGLLEKLREEPQTSTQLAEGTEADPLLVARILKHLAAYSLVKEAGKDQYAATSFSHAVSDPAIKGGLIYSFDGMIPAFQGLAGYLAKTKYQVPRDMSNGPVQHALQTDKPFFTILQENARLGSAFNDFMTGYGKARPSWVDYYPVEERIITGSSSETPLLVDVGGGLGRDVLALYTKHPQVQGSLILQETPSVIAQAQSSTPPLPSAITPMPHDFFNAQPSTAKHARAYYMHLVLHDWDDASCRKILTNLHDAMKPGYSKLLINENVLKDVGAPWQQTSLDWTMMAMLVNRERTESQWRELFESVGLRIEGIWAKDVTSESVIEVVLAD